MFWHVSFLLYHCYDCMIITIIWLAANLKRIWPFELKIGRGDLLLFKWETRQLWDNISKENDGWDERESNPPAVKTIWKILDLSSAVDLQMQTRTQITHCCWMTHAADRAGQLMDAKPLTPWFLGARFNPVTRYTKKCLVWVSHQSRRCPSHSVHFR